MPAMSPRVSQTRPAEAEPCLQAPKVGDFPSVFPCWFSKRVASMFPLLQRNARRRFASIAFVCLLPVSAGLASSGPGAKGSPIEPSTTLFDLLCTTTLDRVEGTLADGSPVVASEVGEVRRYSFDLDARRFSSGARVTPIHAIDGRTVIKADPDEIRSFSGVVHMRSQWHLDLDSGVSIRRNEFFGDASGGTVTGRSEWHQRCERAPYTGLPAG
ncbi:MAG: hypothetical protein KF823_15560 [Xanthomonadales bacterium]|nr:hypothetical protein [Xanthomonadales bacterium]